MAGPPRCSGWWPGRLSVLSWNCHSLAQAGRLADIVKVYAELVVILLQGTQKRPVNNVAPYFEEQVGGWVFIHWWAGSSSITYKRTGVSIGYNKKRIKRSHVREIHSPPTALQGRAGGLRIKNSFIDVFVCSLYFPTGAISRVKTLAAQRAAKWADEQLSRVPVRALPRSLARR